MWMPTHVQVTVQRASGLIFKGKGNTNDCFVTIAMGKTRYQTSVKEKAGSSVEWQEECELAIPEQGNRAEIVLTALHRNVVGIDKFLGRCIIPLNELDVYEKPRNRWYALESKAGQESKQKERGHLEVKIAFTVKSGSLTDLSKKDKHKSSMGHLSHMAQSVGGSLLSITSIEKRKGIKNFAKSISSRVRRKGDNKESDNDDSSSIGSIGSLRRRSKDVGLGQVMKSKQTKEDADPGVVSEDDDDFTFDDLSHRSSGSSLNRTPGSNTSQLKSESIENFGDSDVLRKSSITSTASVKPPRAEPQKDEWELKLYGDKAKNAKEKSSDTLRWSIGSPKLSERIEEEPAAETNGDTVNEDHVSTKPNKPHEPAKKDEKESMLSKLKKLRKSSTMSSDHTEPLTDQSERIIIGGENESKIVPFTNNRISSELMQKFEGKSKEDLILLVCELQGEIDRYKKKAGDLENYLDELLLRVMETTPRILQNPYAGCKMGHPKLA